MSLLSCRGLSVVIAMTFASGASAAPEDGAPSGRVVSEEVTDHDDRPDDGELVRLGLGGTAVAVTSGIGGAVGVSMAGGVAVIGGLLVGFGPTYLDLPQWVGFVVLGAGAVLALVTPVVAAVAAAWLADWLTGSRSSWWWIGSAALLAAVTGGGGLMLLSLVAPAAATVAFASLPVWAAVGATIAWVATAEDSSPDDARAPSPSARLRATDPPPHAGNAMMY